MLGTQTPNVNIITSVTELITGTNTDEEMGQHELIAITSIKGHEKELQLILKLILQPSLRAATEN